MTKTIPMGNHYIEVKQGTHDKTARLNSGKNFGILEIEKAINHIRIKDLELGSAYVTPKQLAMMLKEAGLAEVMSKELEDVM